MNSRSQPSDDSNRLLVFNNPDFGMVRTLEEDGSVLFCGSDVATALGYVKPQNAIAAHCKGALKRGIPTTSGEQEMLFIPEADLYRLVFSSKLPTSEKFTDWVTSEVLPSIRRHGAYMTSETLEAAILNPDTMIKILTELKTEKDKRKALEATNSALTVETQIMKPKADYFDDLVDRNLLTNFRDTAKELHIKQNELIHFLLDRKYIYRDKKGNLKPYADKPSDLFEIKETLNDKTGWRGTQTLVTPKGRETFRLLCI